jgi:CHRD domain
MTLASSYNPAYITANGGTPSTAETALFAGLAAGNAYLNIHTTNFTGGEIRGFLSTATPEPGTWLFSLAGLGVIWAAKRKKAK